MATDNNNTFPSNLLSGVLSDSELKIEGTLSSLGLRGFSAYELAVKNGFEGTLEEYLDYLKARIDMKIEDGVIFYKFKYEDEWFELLDLSELIASVNELEETIVTKVDKVANHSLLSDSEIERLTTLKNYDDSELLGITEELTSSIANLSKLHGEDVEEIDANLTKIARDLESLKLFFNDFRTAEDQDEIDARKANVGDSYTKAESDGKYQPKGDYLTSHQDISGKVDKVNGKQLSTNDYTNEDKDKLATIEEGANNYTLPSDVVQDSNYVHTDNNYSSTDKAKVDAIPDNPKYTDTVYNDSAIRLLITELSNRLNGIADSDDTSLDQLSEIVAYIKSNKSLIDSITTNKVSYVDIIDNLVTNVTNKPLSASQGVVLKGMIDEVERMIPTVPTNVSAFANDAGYLTSHQDISGKVDKVSGKGLSTNDYTDSDKNKLASLENYDDTELKNSIPTKMSQLEQDVETGKIDSISVNGVEQEIDSNKNVNLEFVEHGLEYNEANDSMKVSVVADLPDIADEEIKASLGLQEV